VNNRYRWLLLLIFLLFIQISANFKQHHVVNDIKNFAMEGLFQVIETDLNDDRVKEMVIVGKNYVGRELLFYWLTVNEQNQPVMLWKSPNLFEERSILWVAVGNFNGYQKQLLAATNTQLYFYNYEDGSLKLAKQSVHNLEPLNIVAGDVDGDSQDELIVNRIGKITDKYYICYVQVWKYRNDQWILMAQSELLGNIRAIAAGDIDQDGKAEIFVEEGLMLSSGNIHLLKLINNQLPVVAQVNKSLNGAAYALKVKQIGDQVKLVTGTTKGFVNFFSWDGKHLQKELEELSFKTNLVDLEITDINNNQKSELILLGHPNRLLFLEN
jgi:hypothetical protein